MDLGLAGKRVLVTGATRGIGKATALRYADEGASVAITYNESAQEAAELVDQLGGPRKAMAVPYDLRDLSSIDAAVGAVNEAFGGVDVLIANALWFRWGDPEDDLLFEERDTASWTARFRANTEGHMRTAQLVLGGMKESGWGRIVLLSSITAHYGRAKSELYTTSKTALHGFARGLMWVRNGVLVNVVAPGATKTELMGELLDDPITRVMVDREVEQTPSGRLSEPDEIAKLIVFLGSEANGNINGEVIHTAGGR